MMKSPGGVSPLLGGLAALAQAVPAFFQGRQMAMQNQMDREKLAASQEELAAQKLALAGQRLKALGPAAAMGVPGAADAFKSALADVTGAQLGSGQQTQTQGGAMPSLAQVAPDSSAQKTSLESSAASRPNGAAPPASAPQSQSPDRALLEAYGFLTPAQQYVRDNMKELVQVPPEQRIAMLQGAGVPIMPQDAQSVLDLPFQPDPTAQIGILKDISAQIDKVQGGDLTPEGFKAIVQQYAPVMKRYNLDPAQLLTDQRVAQMTDNAKLRVAKLASDIGLNEAQKKRVLTLLPYEVRKDIADTFKANAQGNEANANAAAIPVRLAQTAQRISIEAGNLKDRDTDLQIKLQSATTPGSLANIMAGKEKDVAARQKDLAQMRAFFSSKEGTNALQKGFLNVPDGKGGTIRVDAQKFAQQMQAVHNQINAEEYEIQQYHKNPGYFLTKMMQNDGMPQNVKVTHADGKPTPSDGGIPTKLQPYIKQGYRPQKRNGSWGLLNPADGQWYPAPQ